MRLAGGTGEASVATIPALATHFQQVAAHFALVADPRPLTGHYNIARQYRSLFVILYF